MCVGEQGRALQTKELNIEPIHCPVNMTGVYVGEFNGEYAILLAKCHFLSFFKYSMDFITNRYIFYLLYIILAPVTV